MSVNNRVDKFALFISSHSEKIADNEHDSHRGYVDLNSQNEDNPALMDKYMDT